MFYVKVGNCFVLVKVNERVLDLRGCYYLDHIDEIFIFF